MKPGTDFDHPRRSPAQKLGAILWPSFFASSVASMVLFALFDPVELFELAFPGRHITRQLGYLTGFFLLWMATSASSLFTWVLLRPASRFNPPHDHH